VRVVLLGAPGSGKGTQGVRLAARLAVPHVSTGDMLRHARATGTDLGHEAVRYMDRGELVPDDLMVGLAGERLSRADCDAGFVLDGFPRTVFQAEQLDKLLERAGVSLSCVVALEVGRDEILARLAGRRTCSACNRPWPRAAAQAAAGRCTCGGTLAQRPDDREEAVLRRLDVYVEQTGELIDWYSRRSLLRAVDGTGDLGQVSSRIAEAVGVGGAP